MRRQERLQREWNERAVADSAASGNDLPEGTEFDEDGNLVPSVELDEGERDEPEVPRKWLKREVADHFRVHFKTIEVWRKKYGLPCLTVGGTVRFVISDVLRWASARKEGV